MQYIAIKIGSMNELSEVITQLRKRTGWTQARLGQEVGKDASWVSRWESGIPKEMPPPDVVRRVCLLSGVSMRTLLERMGYLDPEGMESGTIPNDTPRAALLDVVKNATDDELEVVTRHAEIALGLAPLGGSLPQRLAQQSHEDDPTNRSA
jgi:transcriptional regulator with XRE-family HTH domain